MSGLARAKSTYLCSVGGNTSPTSEPVSAARSTSLPCNSTADPPTPERSLEAMSADDALEEDPKSDPPQYGAKVLSSTIQHDTNDAESHQPSLEGILAMIESAVYPHCAVASSPAGSSTAQSEHHCQNRTAAANECSVDLRTADKENVERDAESQVEKDDAVALPPSSASTRDTRPTITVTQPSEDDSTPTSPQRTLRDATAQLQTPDANHGRDDDFKSASSDESGPLPTQPNNVSVDEDQGTDDESTEGSATRRDLADLVDVDGVEEESRSPIEEAQSSDAEKLVGDSDCRGQCWMLMRPHRAS
jgi:hypothetical protein